METLDGEMQNKPQKNQPQPQYPQQPQPQYQQQPQPQYPQSGQPQFYPQGVPAETPGGSGMIMGILAIVFGMASLIGTIFTAPIGIILGALSITRGQKTLGIIGVVLSVVLAIIGLILGILMMDHSRTGGIIFPISILF